MPLVIRDIAYHLPTYCLGNKELGDRFPQWNVDEVERRMGVKERRIAAPEETALDMAILACQKLFNNYPTLSEAVDGLLFCTQTPDYLIPSNASLLHSALQLQEGVMAFDINLACSGFPYALGIAEGLLASGAASQLLLINADTYSRCISAEDRATRMLFGDGAAVTWVSGSGRGGELRQKLFSSSGQGWQSFYLPAGGYRQPKSAETAQLHRDKSGNRLSQEHIHMNGLAILNFVKTKVAAQIRALCTKAQLALQEVDLFVFHQASQMALESLVQQLAIEQQRVVVNLEDIGNTVSASIPIALKQAQAAGRLKEGHRVVLSGFGAGLSWSTLLLQY